jgi:5-methylcytosine-specific restriction protein B
MIGGGKVQLWKAQDWSADSADGADRLNFEIILPDIGIRPEEFTSIKYFKVTVSLLVKSRRMTKGRAFFPLELAEPFTEEAMRDIRTYQDTGILRRILFFPDLPDSDSCQDIIIYKSGDNLVMKDCPYIEKSIVSNFTDNTALIGTRRMKDKTLRFFSQLTERKELSAREMPILNVYDAFCVPYIAKPLEPGDESEEEDDLNSEQEDAVAISQEMGSLVQLLTSKKQIVLQGAPGVGKTYATKEAALRILHESIPASRSELNRKFSLAIDRGQIAFVTFHQSMDYEDFVEGYKPAKNPSGLSQFTLQDGPFKTIVKACVGVSAELKFEEAWEKFIDSFEGLQNIEARTIAKNTSFYVRLTENEALCVGTKPDEEGTYHITKEQIKNWVLFGTNPGYNTSYAKGVAKLFQDKYHVGPYSPDSDRKPHVLIIDEINRGNVSKVLGELITALETDKREADPGEELGSETIPVQLAYSHEYLIVPYNLYIIGTMNTADRSLGQIDYALRRRFAFFTIRANSLALKRYYAERPPELLAKALGLFEKVQTFFGTGSSDGQGNVNRDFDPEDVMVGHSYFMAPSDEALDAKLKYELVPLLEEYRKDGILNCQKDDEAYQKLIKELVDDN